MDIDGTPNGISKRKSRSSLSKSVNYKDDSDSDEGAPLVCVVPVFLCCGAELRARRLLCVVPRLD